MGLALFMLWGVFASVLSGQALPTAAPDEVGLSARRLARIDSLMAGYLAQGKLPGVVTVIARRGQIVHFHGQGLADVEAERPIQPETLFRIASMTKPITSVAMMMLYEEGRFQLEDPVSTYIPTFKHLKVLAHPTDRPEESALQPLEREITLRDLLTHTSGLSYGFSNAPIDSLYRQIWSPDHTLADMMDLLWMGRCARDVFSHRSGRGTHCPLHDAAFAIGVLSVASPVHHPGLSGHRRLAVARYEPVHFTRFA